MLVSFEEGTTTDHPFGSHVSEQVQRGGELQSWVTSLQNVKTNCGAHPPPAIMIGSGMNMWTNSGQELFAASGIALELLDGNSLEESVSE